MTSRDRCTTPSSLHTNRSEKRRKREYLATYKKTEQQLIALQRDVQEQQRQQQESAEKNLILSELIYVQERTNTIHEKHKRWLAAGGPTEEDLQLQQQLEVAHQVGGSHWCLCALETASWEQLQAAVSYNCTQWTTFLNNYFQKLVFLSEILKRSPEQQAQLLQASGISPAPHVPLVYNYQGLKDTITPAWAAVLEALQNEGSLALLALLHGNMALYEAASRHAVTGQQCVAPPTFWARVAQRMRFTRLQKLHFKLALENHARQAQAAAAQGISVLHQTPSYAFLLACEAIAAQQQSSEGLSGPAAAAAGLGPAAAAAGPAAAAAAAGCEVAGVRNGGLTPASSSGSQTQQRMTLDAAASATVAADSGAGDSSTAAAAGDGPGAAAEGGAAAAAAAAAALAEGWADEDMKQGPGAELEQKMALYMRQWVALNLCLKDSMSPEQNLLMSMGSYPFWPLPASICGAAIQLPNDSEAAGTGTAAWQDAAEVLPDSIDLLLLQRRHTMAETHDSLMPTLMQLRL